MERPLEGVDVPRAYQAELLGIAASQNTIVRMDTGTGKSLVAVMLIKQLKIASNTKATKLALFLVPTNPLVVQQGAYLKRHLPSSVQVRTFRGADNVEFWDHAQWQTQLQDCDVMVCTPAIFLDMLESAYAAITDASIVVFDEAHHATGNHPYVAVMRHYHAWLAENPHQKHQLPKILGLTASPIYNARNLSKTIAGLQGVLDSRIVECLQEQSDLKANTFKPVERFVHYRQSHSSAAASVFQDLLLSHDAGNMLHPEIWKKVEIIKAELGSLGADIYICKMLKEALKTAKADNSYVRPEDMKLAASLKAILSFQQADEANISSKVAVLFDALAARRDPAPFSALVFVEQRPACYVLSKLIKKAPQLTFIRPGRLMGHGSHGKPYSESTRTQSRVVKEMHRGIRNLLVCTSIAEEGLDLQACRLVIRFDLPAHNGSYVQSRGRARTPHSEMIFMVDDDSSEESWIRNLQRVEPSLSQIYHEESKEATTPVDEYENLPSLKLPSGARVTYRTAKSRLCQLYALLSSNDKFADDTQPIFECIHSEAPFQYSLTLPHSRYTLFSVHFIGDPHESKKMAEQSVAFKAVKSLQEAGAFNDYFLPLRAEAEAGDLDADGNMVNTSVLPSEIPVQFQDPLGTLDGQLYMHSVQFSWDDRAYPPLAFICGRKLHISEKLQLNPFLFADPPRIQISEATELSLPEATKSQRLAELASFTRLVAQALSNRRIKETVDPFRWNFLIAPLDDNGTICWYQVQVPTRPIVAVPALQPNDLLIAPFANRLMPSRLYRLQRVRSDLSLDSPDDTSRRLTRTQQRLPFPTLGQLFSDMERGYHFSELPASDDILEVKALPIPALVDGIFTGNREYRAHEPVGYLPRSRLAHCSLQPAFIEVAKWMAPMAKRIRDELLVQKALEQLRLPLDRNLVIMALTLPRCHLGYDYETLETIGDTFLKLATSVHLFQTKPERSESYYSKVRSNSTDNRFLRHKGLSLGLPSLMISDPIWIHGYTPDLTFHESDTVIVDTTVPVRSLSDVMEALVGAAFVQGGVKLALEVGTQLLLPIGGGLMWSKRANPAAATGPTPVQTLQALEHRLDYKFRCPELLVEALTHASAPMTHHQVGPNYERLEFLGDAVIDVFVLSACYVQDPNLPPSILSRIKPALVSNGSLAYLAMTRLELHKHLLHNSPALQAYITQAQQEVASFDVDEFALSTCLWDPAKPISDCFEAVIGAVFVDSHWDIRQANHVLARLYGDLPSRLVAAYHVALETSPRTAGSYLLDPISQLHQYKAQTRCSFILVEEQAPTGPDFAGKKTFVQSYYYTCTWHGQRICSATAASKEAARQSAALKALVFFKGHPDTVCPCRVLQTGLAEMIQSVSMNDEDSEATRDIGLTETLVMPTVAPVIS